MNNKVTKATACILAGAITIGSVSYGVVATPTAGVSSYTSNIMTSSTMPTAGVSLAFSNTMVASAEQQIVANVVEKDAPSVAESGETQEAAPAKEEKKSEYADVAIAQVNDSLNVRAGASEEADIVGKLYNNNAAVVLGEENGWYQIQSGNLVGYVKCEFVCVGNEDVVRAATRRIANVNVETLRVRKEATTDSGIISLVPIGDELTVVDESIEGWTGVSVEEGTGYVSSEFVSVSTEYTYGETNEEIAARIAKEEEERRAAQAAAEAAAARAAARSSASMSNSYVAPAGTGGSAVVGYASQFVGNPYVYGGSSLTGGTDCSGFVMSVYGAFGVGLPHSSYAMRSVGYGVDVSAMQPGDIVCYSGHVAIYAGNNTIVHAANERLGITYTSPANYNTILAVRRIF